MHLLLVCMTYPCRRLCLFSFISAESASNSPRAQSTKPPLPTKGSTVSTLSGLSNASLVSHKALEDLATADGNPLQSLFSFLLRAEEYLGNRKSLNTAQMNVQLIKDLIEEVAGQVNAVPSHETLAKLSSVFAYFKDETEVTYYSQAPQSERVRLFQDLASLRSARSEMLKQVAKIDAEIQRHEDEKSAFAFADLTLQAEQQWLRFIRHHNASPPVFQRPAQLSQPKPARKLSLLELSSSSLPVSDVIMRASAQSDMLQLNSPIFANLQTLPEDVDDVQIDVETPARDGSPHSFELSLGRASIVVSAVSSHGVSTSELSEAAPAVSADLAKLPVSDEMAVRIEALDSSIAALSQHEQEPFEHQNAEQAPALEDSQAQAPPIPPQSAASVSKTAAFDELSEHVDALDSSATAQSQATHTPTIIVELSQNTQQEEQTSVIEDIRADMIPLEASPSDDLQFEASSPQIIARQVSITGPSATSTPDTKSQPAESNTSTMSPPSALPPKVRPNSRETLMSVAGETRRDSFLSMTTKPEALGESSILAGNLVTALFAYDSKQPDGLVFEVGDVMKVLERVDDNWISVSKLSAGPHSSGLAPTNYIAVMNTAKGSSPTRPVCLRCATT